MFSLIGRRRKRGINIDTTSDNPVIVSNKEITHNPSPIQKQSTINMLFDYKNKHNLDINSNNVLPSPDKQRNNNDIQVSFDDKHISKNLGDQNKDDEKQKNFDFRNYIQNIETDEIKHDKQLRIQEENKYKLWVKSQE